MKGIFRWISAILLTCILLPVLPAQAEADALVWLDELPEKTTVVVDFSTQTGVPLLKRQNVFSPSGSFAGDRLNEFIRDVPTLAQLHAENHRVDLFMGAGGVGGDLGKGTQDDLQYDWTRTDMIFEQFYNGGVLPYVVYFATPNALHDTTRGEKSLWKYPPVSYEAWQEVCAEIADHYRMLGWPFAAHEVWNEPDWGDTFFGGEWAEYISIYEHAAKGIRSANPYAMVGGMSMAEIDVATDAGEVKLFLDHVQERALPLDFISYHCYVTRNYADYTDLANDALAAYGDTFATTGLHLNEFHVALDSKATSTERCVGPMMDAILYTLEHPQITSVNWACFRVSGEPVQLINSRTGERFAAYHVLDFYNRMPFDRVALKEKNGLKGIASIEGQQAGVMLYNRTYKARDYVLALQNLPWDKCDVTVYCVDKEHSNFGLNGGSDEPAIILQEKGVSPQGLCIQGELLSNGLIYVEIVESGYVPQLQQVTDYDEMGHVISGGMATVLRREYYFEDRSTTMFSEFDLRTFTAWAGMGNAERGLSKGSVYLENLPEQLVARPALNRDLAQGAAIYLTAEYLDDAGQAVLTQHYRLGENVAVQAADAQLLPVHGEIVLMPPEGFNGVLKLTWGLVDAGMDTTLKIVLDKE